MTKRKPDELSEKLRSWTAEVRIPRSFEAEVWQRIAARQAAQRRTFWHWLREGLWVELGQPQYATALIAVSVALSLGIAHLNATRANARHWRTLQSRYVSSITPVANPAQSQ